MDVVNAIAKARFATARPQRVQLSRAKGLKSDLLCMEPGQELSGGSGERLYYVIAGTAAVGGADKPTLAPAGQMVVVADGEPHTIACSGEQRLVCLVVDRGE